MPTHLRLHKDHTPASVTEGPASYSFPTAMASARRTLVAGIVNVPAIPEAPDLARHAPRSGVLARVGGGVDRTTETDRLLRQVETTLDDMQTKLDTLSGDAAMVFRLPMPREDDGRPWAA